MGLAIKFPEWEDKGVVPPEGLRDFVPGTYVKAKWLDGLMYANWEDHVAFLELFQKYGAAARFLFPDFITLVNTGSGEPPEAGVVGKWPAWKFSGQRVEELYLYVRFPATSGKVRLIWTVEVDSGPNVVWGIEVQPINVGTPFDLEGQVKTVVAQAAAGALLRNDTEIEFGPIASEDLLLGIRIFRDADSSEDDGIPAYLVAAEVVT